MSTRDTRSREFLSIPDEAPARITTYDAKSRDTGAPVSEEYDPRGNAFNGKVKGVQIAIADAASTAGHHVSPQEAVRVAMARQ